MKNQLSSFSQTTLRKTFGLKGDLTRQRVTLMNFISQKINPNKVLFLTTVLASATVLSGALTETVSGQTTQEVQRVREYCRRVVKPSPGGNHNVYTRCLSDRGVYTKDSNWWRKEVRSHCNGVPTWNRNAWKRCYTDRGLPAPY